MPPIIRDSPYVIRPANKMARQLLTILSYNTLVKLATQLKHLVYVCDLTIERPSRNLPYQILQLFAVLRAAKVSGKGQQRLQRGNVRACQL